MKSLGNSWDSYLAEEFKKEYYLVLREFLKQEYAHKRIFPDMYHIFDALKTTSYEDTKIVILGQDPYHGEGQAHGMAFSVQPGVAVPPSLKNIYKELTNTMNYSIPNNGYLMKWAKQGTLLLNTVLTVEKGKPQSHKRKGWEKFTDTIIRLLNDREDPIIFMLWGAPAKKKQQLITNKRHIVLTAAHPSPLSAHNGFFGCDHFQKANDYLIEMKKTPIDWQIEDII